MPFLLAKNSVDIIVPAGQKICVTSYGAGTATIEIATEPANYPAAFSLLTSITNSDYTSSAFTRDTIVKITAGLCEAEYIAGVNPFPITHRVTKLRETVSVKDFGAAGDGVTDDTAAIQNALNAGAGNAVFFPSGTYKVSKAASPNANAVFLVSANTLVYGVGKASRIIQTDGAASVASIFVNKNYDTIGGFGADGNIVYQDLYLDGGNLIGICHSENTLVQRVYGGNHHYHFVDICGSKNTTVRDCVHENALALNNLGQAVIQIDGTSVYGIPGAFTDNTGCDGVYIYNNRLKQVSDPSLVIQLCHARDCDYKNIEIIGNTLDGCHQLGGNEVSIVSIDSNYVGVTLDNVKIKDNTFICRYGNGVALRLQPATTANGPFISNIEIDGNTFTGVGKAAIHVGGNSGDSFARVKDVKIRKNTVLTDFSNSLVANQFVNCISARGVEKLIIEDNIFTPTRATDTAVAFIRSLGSPFGVIRGNYFSTQAGSALSTCDGIYMENASVGTYTDATLLLDGNTFDGNIFNNFIRMVSENPGIRVLATRNNQFGTKPKVAHINSVQDISAGDNFRRVVDLSSIGATTGGSVAIASSSTYSGIDTGLVCLGNDQMYGLNIDLRFAQGGVTLFDTAQQRNTFSVTPAGTVVGIYITNINASNGTFTLVTGNGGVNVRINETTRVPEYGLSGQIKIYASC